MVLNSSHLFKICIKCLAFDGEFLIFWRNGLVAGAILAIFSDFNLFKLGEFRLAFGLLGEDAILTFLK